MHPKTFFMRCSMITIIPYDTRWPEAFIAIARPLRAALGELALRIDHIGSTSVPGLAAKDVIDVQVTLKDFSCTSQLVVALGSLGYPLAPDVTGYHLPRLHQGHQTDWQNRCFRPPAVQRPTHLHVRALERPKQRVPLLFRASVRAHPVTH